MANNLYRTVIDKYGMPQHGHEEYITNKERREFLKALGVAGAVTAGGTGLQEVREAMAASSSEELASIGQAIQADLTGTMDAQFITDQQAVLAAAVSDLPVAVERGLPVDEPHHAFSAVEEAGRPIYDHLGEAGFFESTTKHLPAFNPSYLESAIEAFVSSEVLAEPLADLGLTGSTGVNLLAEVIANAEELSDYHWVATDEIPREQIEFGEYIPPMTQGAAGGALLWLKDLDHHLWTHQVVLTQDILSDAGWHGQSMAAGFQLMAEGAKAIASDDAAYADSDLAALLSTGFAVQAISQGLLPQDVYWITEEMRGERRTDLQKVGSD